MMLMCALGGGNAGCALFLEAVQHEYGLGEADGVDRTVSSGCVILHHFQHSCAAEARQWFGGWVTLPQLRQSKRVTKLPAHLFRQGHQFLVTVARPAQWFSHADHGGSVSRFQDESAKLTMMSVYFKTLNHAAR